MKSICLLVSSFPRLVVSFIRTATAMPDAALPTIRQIADALEGWAPPASAQSYDNVGLQVGRPERHVRRALVALDLTPAVVNEAEAVEAQLVVTHHPLLFRPLKSLTPGSLPSALALRLAEAGIALYAAHTNLDAAPGGVSFALAEQLGLEHVSFLGGMDETLVKLVTFVPEAHVEAVRAALAEAGAGRIGDYTACAFASAGTGHFRPGEGTDPHIGEAGGDLEAVAEIRLETEVARWDLGRAARALEAAHPYEEVAYDVYPVEQQNTRAGLGALGRLREAVPLRSFLRHVAERLEAESLRYAGDPAQHVHTVAVCGGAGSDLRTRAMRADADAYVTADVKYHDYFDVLAADGAPQMALIDAGHYETEAAAEVLLRRWLAERFPATDWRRTTHRTSPMRTFVKRDA